ncbi:hypothetical protein P280DRAFT_473600 [Massarina eburnea CBS 473.64]|uniref:N-acetyltransferase domain-containing protein n=1 Tax=Massarina eburnea CBS 473.64 TaxID=1395130 RepID=A0A6A6RL53_9PLEO|nr:hypothetical protein P280DRAFT_473600 [Massarina eburnea CBS 473.64]
MGSYLWYKAYVSLSPETCFVLDDGSGRAVGYIIGASETAGFSQRWRDVFAPILDPKLIPRPGLDTGDPDMEREDVRDLRRGVYSGECSMLQGEPHLLQQYPSHLHINILPEHQRQGWGPKMMKTFLDRVQTLGARGVHLGMMRTNSGAKQFYERLGFRLCNEVLDGGVSGERGRHGDAICLIKDLQATVRS